MSTKASKETFSTLWALAAVSVVTLVSSLAVILLLVYAGETPKPPLVLVLAGSVLLTAIVVPSLYGFAVIPLSRRYEARLRNTALGGNGQGSPMDSVTRLPSRRTITASLLETMAQAERYGHPLSVALVEVDDYKKLGEKNGAKPAERFLQGVAEVFMDTLRMPDKAGRYENQEFLVVLPNTGLKDANKIMERVRNAVSNREFSHAGKTQKLSVSVGATQYRKGEDLVQLLARADQAKQEAIKVGRNQVIIKKAGK